MQLAGAQRLGLGLKRKGNGARRWAGHSVRGQSLGSTSCSNGRPRSGRPTRYVDRGDPTGPKRATEGVGLVGVDRVESGEEELGKLGNVGFGKSGNWGKREIGKRWGRRFGVW